MSTLTLFYADLGLLMRPVVNNDVTSVRPRPAHFLPCGTTVADYIATSYPAIVPLQIDLSYK